MEDDKKVSTREPERLLPEGLPVGTISLTMSKDEAAARESTVSILLKTIVQEAETLLHSEGKHAYASAMAQAWRYVLVLEERQPDEGEEAENDDEWLDRYMEGADLTGYDHLREHTNEHGDTIQEASNSPKDSSEEAESTTHGAAAMLLGLTAALRQHIRGIAALNDLSPGHCQAAVGMNVSIENLLGETDLQHEISCHHCNFLDRAHEGARTIQVTLESMRPAIRALTKLELHPSLQQNPEDVRTALKMADEIVNNLANHQLTINGDDGNPHQSIQSFYLNGILHIKRLSDPFPEGVSGEEAIALAERAEQLVTEHAKDHAEGFGQALLARTQEMREEAENRLHTVSNDWTEQG